MLRRTTPVAYSHCPDCGLTVPLRALYLALDVCPRCVARRRVARGMLLFRDRLPASAAGHAREAGSGRDVRAAA